MNQIRITTTTATTTAHKHCMRMKLSSNWWALLRYAAICYATNAQNRKHIFGVPWFYIVLLISDKINVWITFSFTPPTRKMSWFLFVCAFAFCSSSRLRLSSVFSRRSFVCCARSLFLCINVRRICVTALVSNFSSYKTKMRWWTIFASIFFY